MTYTKCPTCKRWSDGKSWSDDEVRPGLLAAAKLMAEALNEIEERFTYDPMYQHIDASRREVSLVESALKAWNEVSND